MPGDRVQYKRFVKAYRDGGTLDDIATAQRTEVADVMAALAKEGVLLRTRAISELPDDVRHRLAGRIDAEAARCRDDETMRRKYGLTPGVLKSLRITAALLRRRAAEQAGASGRAE